MDDTPKVKNTDKAPISVYDKGGNLVRTYTVEEHTDKNRTHRERAEGFAEKIGGSCK